jgi:hypothetical protein
LLKNTLEGEKNMTTPDTTLQDWTDSEMKELSNNPTNYEKRPALKLEENKLTEIVIDVSKPFEKYNTTNKKGDAVIKAIIPVLHNGEKKYWWLNKKNPTYREIVTMAKGKTSVVLKVIQTGKQENTKYAIVQ